MGESLVHPIAAPPEPGQALGLGHGVHWVRLPLPGKLRHINVWLLEDGEGWTLIDTGMGVKECRDAWTGPLAGLLASRPLKRVVLTHHHPDHAGLAAWFAERHGVPVHMSAEEAGLLRGLLDEDPVPAEARVAAFAADGLVPTDENRVILAGGAFRRVVSGIPKDLRLLCGGDVLDIGGVRWEAMRLPGHTDGQLAFHAPAAGLLISGDQVLPRITSNIGVYPERADLDPIASFVGSFASLAALDPEPLVLPSHGEVFRGLKVRLKALEEHHAATLEQVVALLDGPLSAAELALLLFRPILDPLNRMLAVGESRANLEHLARSGRARRIELPGQPRRFERAP